MEINNYNSSTENPTESIENRYNYYSSDEPISLELCNQDIIDYIENGQKVNLNKSYKEIAVKNKFLTAIIYGRVMLRYLESSLCCR